MSEISVRKIESNGEVTDDITDLLKMTYDDLIAMGMSDEEAKTFINVSDPEKAGNQALRMAVGESSYNGAYINGRLVGYSKVGEWNSFDQLPFAQGRLETSALHFIGKVAGAHLFGRPVGVHGLVAAPALDDDLKREALDRLVTEAVAAAEGSEMKIALSLHRPGFELPAILNHRFAPTNRIGRPIGSVNQKLYVRPESPEGAISALKAFERSQTIK